MFQGSMCSRAQSLKTQASEPRGIQWPRSMSPLKKDFRRPQPFIFQPSEVPVSSSYCLPPPVPVNTGPFLFVVSFSIPSFSGLCAPFCAKSNPQGAFWRPF